MVTTASSRFTGAWVGIAVGALALIAGACSSSSTNVSDEAAAGMAVEQQPAATAPAPTPLPEPQSTTVQEPTATPQPTATPEPTATPQLTLLDEEFLVGVADEVSLMLTDGAFLFAVIDADGTPIAASSGADAAGNAPTATDPFRVGSVTKVITAATVLTLVDDGLVDLDAPASDYLTRLAMPEGATVRNLLEHRTGIYNYTDDLNYFEQVFATPSRGWTPEEVFETTADRPVKFEPGMVFSYSNTNYIILGVLIEEVTGSGYHEAVRARIFDPLALSPATYVDGFEDGPTPFDPYDHEGDKDYDYTSLATSAWAAGSLVSTAADLSTFFGALFDGQLISQDLIAEMTDGRDYGLGLDLADHATHGIYGHNGGIPGYVTVTRHSPELDVTAFLTLTDSQAQPMFAIDDMLDGFSALSEAASD